MCSPKKEMESKSCKLLIAVTFRALTFFLDSRWKKLNLSEFLGQKERSTNADHPQNLGNKNYFCLRANSEIPPPPPFPLSRENARQVCRRKKNRELTTTDGFPNSIRSKPLSFDRWLGCLSLKDPLEGNRAGCGWVALHWPNLGFRNVGRVGLGRGLESDSSSCNHRPHRISTFCPVIWFPLNGPYARNKVRKKSLWRLIRVSSLLFHNVAHVSSWHNFVSFPENYQHPQTLKTIWDEHAATSAAADSRKRNGGDRKKKSVLCVLRPDKTSCDFPLRHPKKKVFPDSPPSSFFPSFLSGWWL